MSLIQLLAILLSLSAAHAAPSMISLHNKETETELSAVRNWTLLCEDLCSLNISGPACGLDCHQVPVNEDLTANIPVISADDHEELCDNLCEYGLGDNQCECKVQIMAAAYNFVPAIHRPDRYKVCSDACRYYHVTLKGCSHCPFEKHESSRERFYRPNPMPSPTALKPQIPVPQSAEPIFFRQAPQPIQTTPDSTTPDWNKLCAQLCRNGTGGLLCNCDLSPF